MSVLERIDYRFDEGDGRPIVFVHGWLGSKEFWELITPYMDTSRPMLFYNQRCHGGSREMEFSIEDLADDLHLMLEELGLADPLLVGHSMGGMTVLKYATLYDNFSGLCLLGSCADTPEPENKSVEYFLEELDEISREEWAEKIADNYILGEDKQEMREMTQKELLKADERAIREGLEAMMEYDVTEELEELDVEALVVAGSLDGAITVEKSEELAELLDCRLEVLDVTHQMLPERPEKVAGLIEEFSRQVK